MTLAALQEKFHLKLEALYDSNEVDAIFYTLTEHFLQFKRIQVSINKEEQLEAAQLDLFLNALKRLQNHEPVQYIIGWAHFYGLDFRVNQHTLIPRPETEELVDWTLQLADKSKSEIRILDIGTGSGCIAISLAKQLKNSKVFGLDINKNALKIAKENAMYNKTEVEFEQADILNFNPKSALFQKKFDIIISNPPYVRDLEKIEMKPNVLNFEPAHALFVPDDDALKFYKAITKFSVEQLIPGGLIVMEINQYLSKEMQHLMEIYNFESIEVKKDLSGNFRMIKAVKPV